MGAPGCPEFACWTASMASVRIVLMQSVSSFCPVTKTCSLATMRFRSSTGRFPPARSSPKIDHNYLEFPIPERFQPAESVSSSRRTWIELR